MSLQRQWSRCKPNGFRKLPAGVCVCVCPAVFKDSVCTKGEISFTNSAIKVRRLIRGHCGGLKEQHLSLSAAPLQIHKKLDRFSISRCQVDSEIRATLLSNSHYYRRIRSSAPEPLCFCSLWVVLIRMIVSDVPALNALILQCMEVEPEIIWLNESHKYIYTYICAATIFF